MRGWEIKDPKPKPVALRRQIKPLLMELDAAFNQFHELTRGLADKETSDDKAIWLGAERKTVSGIIQGIAWRINKASKGLK